MTLERAARSLAVSAANRLIVAIGSARDRLDVSAVVAPAVARVARRFRTLPPGLVAQERDDPLDVLAAQAGGERPHLAGRNPAADGREELGVGASAVQESAAGQAGPLGPASERAVAEGATLLVELVATIDGAPDPSPGGFFRAAVRPALAVSRTATRGSKDGQIESRVTAGLLLTSPVHKDGSK